MPDHHEFPMHQRIETAPEESRPRLEAAEQQYGFVPNLMKHQAEAPALLEAYQTMNDIFERTSLSPVEQQVVAQSANLVNDCHYCVPAHTAIMKQVGADDATIKAVRNNTEIPDAKLEALHRFATKMVETRGHVGDDELQRVMDAGYSHRQVLEVVVGLSFKVLSNYTNSLVKTPLDPPFDPFAWTKPEQQTAGA
mgnify:FL=1